VIDQFLLDERGSGVTAMGYYGTVKGIDPVAAPTLRSHFTRVGLTANKIVNNFELLGGFAWGKDQDLPLATADISGMGYWVSGQYMFAKSSLTVFGRYEFVDPNTTSPTTADAIRIGGVVPVGLRSTCASRSRGVGRSAGLRRTEENRPDGGTHAELDPAAVGEGDQR
jgi:hypothetical protein